MSTNPLGIRRFGPVTFYVANAAQEAKRLSKMLGMQIAFQSTHGEDVFVLKCSDTIFIIDGSHRAKKEAEKHGDFIAEIGLYTQDANQSLKATQSRCKLETGTCEKTGATYVKAPHDGELYFKFIDDNTQIYPDLKELPVSSEYKPTFNRIDHIVTNSQKIQPIIEFFSTVFGMEKVNEFTIRVQTEAFQASLYSEVMGLKGLEQDILCPVNEPLAGDNESQIPAQIREMGRSHAQHIALATDNIISSISALRSNGMDFLEFRNEEHAKRYYSEVPARLGKITVSEALETLRNLGILVDKCGEGYLLQLFSKRIFPDRSVPFVEIIQRASDVVGCFGDGNFAALAESLEWSMRQGG